MDEISYLGGRELAARIRSGEISSREATEAALRRIEAVNPQVNAVVTLAAEAALEQADAADRRRLAGEDLPALHGVPVLHKDTHATAGMRTTSGSPLLADNVPASDDLVIERMKAAGVISLGKTNTPEFAAGSHTFNPVFGYTHNPYALDRSAGGSSGGAAAALACGMVAFADGSDMGGSLRNPAAFCNVVGLRPSPGRVPNAPDPFGDYTLATSGPMARTIDDTALLLSVMAGPDLRAPAALDRPGSAYADVQPVDPASLRIAVAADFGGTMPVEAPVVAAIEAAGRTFESLGANVERAMPDLSLADDAFNVRRAWQFAAKFAPVIERFPDGVKDTIKWNVEMGQRLSGADIARAVAASEQLYQNVRAFFTEYDALLLPVTQVLPFDERLDYPTQINGQQLTTYLEWMRACSDITPTGAPAISVPAGFSEPTGDAPSLPIGLQIVTQHRAEDKLLSIAKVYEQATGFSSRRPNLG
ncbi:amidase [Epidermidibacterium keratini]|uniref:Amidase n=1 Tax=Epidermidibacterium keratini TaxID=1891644 RepID=A0A7L4YK97_9ACTN|nr:amidase [Epidermidibacterium keratini]QHB98966.1 amidase [Epidermidibacterium keratini]